MEPVSRRSGFAPPATPLTRRLVVYFRSGAYRWIWGEEESKERGINSTFVRLCHYSVVDCNSK